MKSKPVSEHQVLFRLKHLQEKLREEHIDVCLIEDSIDLFYLTGLQLSAGRLFVHSEKVQLAVDGRYIQVAKANSPIEVVLDTKDTFSSFLKGCNAKTIGFNGKTTSYDHFLNLNTLIQKDPTKTLISLSSILEALRLIKDATEIQKMKQSAHLLWKGFEAILSSLKTGITEKEVAKQFEIFCLKQGVDRLGFEPIIAFGKNTAMPHYHPKDVPLKDGDVVLIDIGVVVDHYHSDMTRVTFHGPVDSKIKELYEITKKAQKKALTLCRPGLALGKLDQAVREIFQQEGVEDLFIHSLGHGVGLELHEYPRIKFDGIDKDLLLAPGMVFTVEPGLYLPEIGGVRYEDTIVITEKGYENFYPDGLF